MSTARYASPADACAYLFALEDEAAWRVLQNVITWVEATLTEGSHTGDLLAVLRGEKPQFLQPLDQEIVDQVLSAIDILLSGRQEAILQLIEYLNPPRTRNLAAYLLEWVGPQAQLSLPELVNIASGTSDAVGPAKQAVVRIGHADIIIMDALQQSLVAGDDGDFRELCDLARLSGLNTQDSFLRILEVASRHDNPHIREWVAVVIHQLDERGKQTLAPTLELLKSDLVWHVKEAAVEASA